LDLITHTTLIGTSRLNLCVNELKVMNPLKQILIWVIKKLVHKFFFWDSFLIDGVHFKLMNFKDDCKWLPNGWKHKKFKKGINQCWYLFDYRRNSLVPIHNIFKHQIRFNSNLFIFTKMGFDFLKLGGWFRFKFFYYLQVRLVPIPSSIIFGFKWRLVPIPISKTSKWTM